MASFGNTISFNKSMNQQNSMEFNGSNGMCTSGTSTSSSTNVTVMGVSYENFKIRFSPYYNMQAPNTFVSVPAFGQGVLLDHDIATQQARVQLAAGEIIIVPVSQMALHSQHKMPSFDDFVRDTQINTTTAGGNGAGAVSRGVKRAKEFDGHITHATARPFDARQC